MSGSQASWTCAPPGLRRLAAALATAGLVMAAGLAGPVGGSGALAATRAGSVTASGQPGTSRSGSGTVPVPVASDQLTSLSCAGPSFCAAIGSYSTATASGRTFGEVWRGSAWQLVPSPLSGLTGISCTSATFCMAVGTGGAQTWNGKNWTALPKSPPEVGVSCVSTALCMAVGGGGTSQGIMHEWNGTTWHTLTVTIACPPFHGGCADNFTHVACVGTSFCMAIGWIGLDTPQTVAAKWNGSTWTQESTPTVGPHSAGLHSLSCTSASFCMAVGQTRQGQATMMTWDGASWQLQTPSQAIPTMVTCTSDTSCVAASGTVIESWMAGTWQPFAPPVIPSGTAIALSGLSCTGDPVSHCMTIGDYSAPDLGSLTLAEQWSGTGWDVLPTPSPGAVDGMFDVSCPRASFCMAVGTFVGSGDVQQALAQTWNGRGWKQLTPISPGAQVNYLAGVDCTSATNCVAVGSADNILGHRQALAERWNGSTWTQLDALSPELNDQLAAISCATATSCMAVGSSSAPTRVHTLAEQWNGTRWTVRGTPDPGSTHPVQQFNYLSGVSCRSAKACVAVGYYNKRLPAGSRPLAIAWNGTSWRLQRAPGSSGGLASVSCPSASACLAAGAVTVSDGRSPVRPLAERWNGSSWSLSSPPATGQGSAAHFDGVACAGATACQAVGAFSAGSQIRALSEIWNGSSWHLTRAPSPRPAFSELYAVDCTAATACVAVGERATQQPLAELWNGSRWRVLAPVNPLTPA